MDSHTHRHRDYDHHDHPDLDDDEMSDDLDSCALGRLAFRADLAGAYSPGIPTSARRQPTSQLPKILD